MKFLKYIYIILLIQSYPIKSYVFSVIMAIYNTGRYLDESIGSLLKQTIGYENIQIILINDGSSDNSEEICLKYKNSYNNIIYSKIEHSGVSKARNIGMIFAKGKFINFLDPDDFWDLKAFEHVLSFFNSHKKINFVSGRLKFFEALNVYHPLDYKFFTTRIVNLTEEYNCIQSSSSTSFFKRDYIKGKKFEEGILSGEDTRFVNELLLINPIMGLIREAVYYCRKRNDLTSRTQTQKKDIRFYFSTLKNVSLYLINYSKILYNKIMPFIQYYIAYDLLFRIQSLSSKYLNSFQFFKYCILIKKLLIIIEDRYILEQIEFKSKYKIIGLSRKYNKDLRNNIIFEQGAFKYNNYILENINLKKNVIIWQKINIQNNILHLEGLDELWFPQENYFYFCSLGNKTFIARKEDYSNKDLTSLFGVSEKGKIIIFDINLEIVDLQVIQIYISYLNQSFEILTTQGYFSHIPSINEGYLIEGNYILKMIEHRITIYKYNENLADNFEQTYCEKLKNLGKNNIIGLRKRYFKYKRKFKHRKSYKEIWIINDRKNISGDNGEYFFRYLLTKKQKGIEIYFSILKNSTDFNRLKKIGNVLALNSQKYLNIFLRADKLISSVESYWVDNPFGEEQKYIRDLFHFKFIFINNGIIKDDLSKYLHRIKRNIDLIALSTIREYNSLLNYNYGYNSSNLILSGMPKYDYLENFYLKKNNKENNRIILIIPTFRLYIKGSKESSIFENIHSDSFKFTEYFEYYNSLINDKRLLEIMELYNYTGIFCLSPYFSAQWVDFTKNKIFEIKDYCNLSKLILDGSLLVTDYSSIFFEFGYINKPIIYTQFDYMEYRKFHYPEGYFNYQKDGFGPIYDNINQTVESIINYIKCNCSIEEKYLNRIQSFFIFLDNNNSERLYQHIMNIDNINAFHSMIFIETFRLSFSLIFILIKLVKFIKII